MEMLYGSNYKGKKLGKNNQAAKKAPEEYDPFMYGAAGRGEGLESTGAIYQAASQMGKPMSEAERVMETASGRNLVRSLGGKVPKPTERPKEKTKVDRTAALKNASGVSGLRTTSAGATYGASGKDTLGTSIYDSAGNTYYGTVGGRNIIGGATKGIDRSGGISQDPYEEYMRMLSPQSVIDRQKQIRNEVERSRQSQIDAINQSTQSQIDTQNLATQEDLARQRSMNLRAGLGGSDFGAANKIQVREQGRKAIQQIQANQELAIGQVIDSIDQLANQRFQTEQQALQKGLQNTMQYQQYQQEQRQNAVTRIAELGKAGLDIPTIKERDPHLYENLMSVSGMSDIELESVINNNKPTPQRIDYQYKVAGGKLIAFGVDPNTGQMKVLEQEVDIPDNYTVSTMQDGTVLGIPENWDGDTSKIVTVGNYRKPFASEMGGSGDTTGRYTTTDDPLVKSWVDLISSGQATISNVPAAIKNDVADALANKDGMGTSPGKTIEQLTFLKDTVDDALELVHASGPSGITKWMGDTFVGDTDFRQLESLTNTLRTNVLTLMTDPSIKKFFGPQMSNADVQLMTSTGTTLNPEKQSPTQMKSELERLQDLFTRMKSSIPKNSANGSIIPNSSTDEDEIDAFLNSF